MQTFLFVLFGIEFVEHLKHFGNLLLIYLLFATVQTNANEQARTKTRRNEAKRTNACVSFNVYFQTETSLQRQSTSKVKRLRSQWRRLRRRQRQRQLTSDVRVSARATSQAFTKQSRVVCAIIESLKICLIKFVIQTEDFVLCTGI